MRSVYAAALLLIVFAATPATSQVPAGSQSNSGSANGQPDHAGNAQPRQAALPHPMTNVGPRAPSWLSEINAEHKKFIDDLLDYWQGSSDKVKRYQCEFVRYEYDTTFCNWRDPQTNRLAASAIMTGEIRFAAPDKACYETLRVFDFAGPPEQDGQDPKYLPRDETTNRDKTNRELIQGIWKRFTTDRHGLTRKL